MTAFFRSFFTVFLLTFGFFNFMALADAEVESADVHLEQPVDIYFFHSEGCPHCKDEKAFLATLDQESFELHSYGVETSEGREKLAEVSSIAPHPVQGVPLTVIGETFVAGYMTDETTGVQILDAMERVNKGQEQDLLGLFFSGEDVSEILAKLEAGMAGEVCALDADVCELPDEKSQEVDLPFFGKKDVKSFSLPALTVIIAFLDGFNPCAMWVLIFLISVLMGMENRKRMWILGGTFIFASGFVYFLLLSAWLNVFFFIGFLRWIQVVIGLLALGTAAYYLYDGITNEKGECKVDSSLKKKETMDRVKKVVHHDNLWIALVGIVVVAFAVNVLEALCSAGLPAVYTQVLSMSDLPIWQYYGYLVLYIVVFMIDDLFVFGVAMMTLKYANINTKYARWSHLIGGVILLAIGALLLFKPSWLLLG